MEPADCFNNEKTPKNGPKIIFLEYVTLFRSQLSSFSLCWASLSWEMGNWVYWKQRSHRQFDVRHIGITCLGFHLLWFCLLRTWKITITQGWHVSDSLMTPVVPVAKDYNTSVWGWLNASVKPYSRKRTVHIRLYWWQSLWYSPVTPE